MTVPDESVPTVSAERAGPPEPGGGRLGLALLVLGTCAVLVVLAAALRQPSTGPRPGQPAPGFTLTTFDGRTIRLADLLGDVVVLNFWASWCVTCADEAAELESLWREYRERGVTVLGIDYTDTRPAALAYLERHRISYPNGPDQGGRISRAYRLTGVPETLVVDRAGRAVALPIAGPSGIEAVRLVGALVPGAPLAPDALRALLDRLLVAGGTP